MRRPATTPATSLRPFRAHAHVAVDEDSDGFLPGRNLLVRGAFAAVVVEFRLQHFVDFIVFGRNATGLALRPATRRGGSRLPLDFEFIVGFKFIAVRAARRRSTAR